MKSSDVAPLQTNPARNLLAESLCDRNAARIHSHAHWTDTPIAMTQGAAESTRGYGRDQAISSFDRRKRLHSMLDAALSEAGYESGTDTEKMHAALDKQLDEEEARGPSESEEPEEGEDYNNPDFDKEWSESDEQERQARGEKSLDALVYRVLEKITGAQLTKDSKVSYATDSALISAHLSPEMFAREAAAKVYALAYEKQADNPQRGFWVGLWQFLHDQPKGTRIRDCNQAALSTLLSRTLAA
jgi:hypothetical protein